MNGWMAGYKYTDGWGLGKRRMTGQRDQRETKTDDSKLSNLKSKKERKKEMKMKERENE